jgi:aspartate aminotransferase-like enzyme
MIEKEVINFMPGPVNIHAETRNVFYNVFLSHRSAKFYSDVKDFRQELCSFVNAQNVAFLVGSGSIANEVTAQYLKQLGGKGLILVNGEFGKRLTEQASNIELIFDTYQTPLGSVFNYSEIETKLKNTPYKWIWLVNCETSSGVLNNLKLIKEMSLKYHVKVALDCISTIGNIEVDLSGIFIASGTSGKGLACYPGIAMVYFENEVLDLQTKAIPKYMNLKHHTNTNLVPYTISTNLFYALQTAFKGINRPSHRNNIIKLGEYIYNELQQLGFTFLGNRDDMMPGMISIICPNHVNSYDLGVELEKNNFYVNYGGAYLREANYFQICIMGHQTFENAKKIVDFLKRKQIVKTKELV